MCIGWLGLSLLEAKRCTPLEFSIYMKARRFRRQERQEDMAYQAWKNREIKADKKSGKGYKPYFKNFTEFYDSEKAIKNIIQGDSKPKKLSLADKNRMLSRIRKEGMNG